MSIHSNTIRIFILGLFSILASCNSGKVDSGKENARQAPEGEQIVLTEAQVANAGIETASPVRKTIASTVRANGILDVPPQNLISVSAKMGGFVKKTLLLQGIHVHKGDPLCVLENPEYLTLQQEYLSNQSRLRYLEKESRRQSDLAKENVASVKTSELSEADLNELKSTQAGLAGRLVMLGFSLTKIEKGILSPELVIPSPIDGYVTQVGINLGKYIQPNDLVCEIVNLDHIHADLMVYEQDIPEVKEGQRITFSLVGKPDQIYNGSIYLINKKINPDRTVQVHAHLDKMVPELIPNMQILAFIRTSEKEVWTLPSTAFVNRGNKTLVFVSEAKKGSFSPLEVRTGTGEAGSVGVVFPGNADPSNLKIVVKGAYDLKAFSENKEEE